ncbi:MAG: hypothetical protein ACM3U1_07295 [Chloroflexota bacterium]
MKKIFLVLAIIMTATLLHAQARRGGQVISPDVRKQLIKELSDKYPGDNSRIQRGIEQSAALWIESDGSEQDFSNFVRESFAPNGPALESLYQSIAANFESIFGHFNKMSLDMKRSVHLVGPEPNAFDLAISGYDPSAHITEDFFANKIAFMIVLNFPAYTLDQKNELGAGWTPKDWAYARIGDMFTSRPPADLLLKVSESFADADNYISNYNIYVGNLVDKDFKTYFPKDMKLITHWNLRDEIKSQYSDKKNGLASQKMIYEVMKHIVAQDIPAKVINSGEFQWNPVTNEVFSGKTKVASEPEPDARYQKLLNNFLALRALDQFTPLYPTYIDRKFNSEMEIPQEKVEQIFVSLVSSPEAKQVGKLIEKRLGRKLQPFDIWYDGFKSRSSISPEKLDAATKAKYPNAEAVQRDLPNILTKLGYAPERASEIVSRVEVDASRGAGHAWGADMRTEKAHLRTRIGEGGMDYKGYNIAVHEFGHNVEQTITLYNAPEYMIRSVPNTAFTEAWAFVFQKRDLDLLGIKDENPNKEQLLALDNFWSCYEIMGVSLVDQRVWKWLYANPDATAAELKVATIGIAKDVWNSYFAPVFGMKDEPILAIYSHMIDNPLYLSAYPIGHLIEFQMEKQMKGKNLASEMERMLRQGRLTPKYWMLGAVGSELSAEPVLEATREALKVVKD